MAYEIPADGVSKFEIELAERLNETLANDFHIDTDNFTIRLCGNGSFELDLEEDVETLKDDLPTIIPSP
jgi:hypothetical protein